MNSQVEILHKTLEELSESGGVRYHFNNSREIEITPENKYRTKRIARALLDEFPKEDSDHVKAYRALVFLSEYLETKEYETGYHVDDYTIEEQLRRIRGQIADKARSDVLERLEIDTQECSFGQHGGIEHTYIFDPVSKFSRRISNAGMERQDIIDQTAARTAHEVIEPPL